MNTTQPIRILDIYQTDLDRHLFAPAPRPPRQYRWRPSLEALSDRLQERLALNWQRVGKAVAAFCL